MRITPTTSKRARRGFTIVEMLVTMLIFVIVVAATMRAFISHTRTVAGSAGRLDALQNARFAANAIDRELRMIGVGVVDAQPMVVQADPFAITFNADLVTRIQTDIGAVYYDPDAPASTATSLGMATPVQLPLSGWSYPDTNYFQGSALSALPGTAETVSYWLTPDTATAETDDYVLNRRVNNTPARVVARHLVRQGAAPAFRYYKLDSLDNLVEIPTGILPLLHGAAIHGSHADSAASALTDSIVMVKLRLDARYVDRTGTPRIRSIQSNVRLMNAGLIRHSVCGEVPIFGRTIAAAAGGAGVPQVTLSWIAAVDEVGGEKDIERYAIYRRGPLQVDFGEPLASIAAGQPVYSFTDTQVNPGESWIYGVAAQDCTPANSPASSTGVISVPVLFQ
jgi:prepilin-type N-terminal cleavage/methylation domain-containing protein